MKDLGLWRYILFLKKRAREKNLRVKNNKFRK